MTEPKPRERDKKEMEVELPVPFELEKDEAASADAAERALAEHQLEAIEEVAESFFDIEEEATGTESPEEENPSPCAPEEPLALDEDEEEVRSEDAAALALAEHQLEAMEEVAQSFFDIEEEAVGTDGAEDEEDLSPAEDEEDDKGRAEDADTPLVVEVAEAKHIVESLLFLAHEPLRPRDISVVFRGVGNINAKVVRKILAELVEEYSGRPLQIVEVAEGFRMCTRPQFSDWVRRFLKADRKTRLSQAAMEVLAIVAYKQPITRPEVEEIRRVDCSGVLHTLLERNLLRILGRRDVVGKPIVYGTTPYFLEHFGFKNLADLPRPDEFDGADILAGAAKVPDLIPLDEDNEKAGNGGLREEGEEEAAPAILEGNGSALHTNGGGNSHGNGNGNGHANGEGNGHGNGGSPVEEVSEHTLPEGEDR